MTILCPGVPKLRVWSIEPLDLHHLATEGVLHERFVCAGGHT